MRKGITNILVYVLVSWLLGCASGIDFSEISQDAKDFHPKTIGVLPPTVGKFEASRDVVGPSVSQELVKCGWFDNVVDTLTIKTQIANSGELADDIADYLQKLNTLGVSDPGLSARLGQALHVDALFLTYVSSWGYGRMEGNKVARVGLGVRLVDCSKGTIIWKASHEVVKEYWIFKPKLADLSKELTAQLIDDMPH